MKILFLFLPVFIFISGCSPEKVKPSIRTDLKTGEIPTQESWNSKIIFTDSGKTAAILSVGHLQMFSKSMETFLDSGLILDFYNELGQKSTTLTARRGKVDDRQRNLYAYENVVTKNDSGVTLTTEELMWDNTRSKIVTDKFVTITTPYENIQGYGFESDQFLRNYVIYRITYITQAANLGK